jgi:hypothetical protein
MSPARIDIRPACTITYAGDAALLDTSVNDDSEVVRACFWRAWPNPMTQFPIKQAITPNHQAISAVNVNNMTTRKQWMGNLFALSIWKVYSASLFSGLLEPCKHRRGIQSGRHTRSPPDSKRSMCSSHNSHRNVWTSADLGWEWYRMSLNQFHLLNVQKPNI